jgi:hypothetical protein
VLGSLLAAAAGFRGLLLCWFGFILTPFLIGPVWRAVRGVYPPNLVKSTPAIITLDLDRH